MDPYVRENDFTDDESNNVGGRSTVLTAQLDAELDAILASIATGVSDLAILLRGDDKMQDNILEGHEFSAAALAVLAASLGSSTALTETAAWVTATDYIIGNFRTTDNRTYMCMVAHTSAASFYTDLDASNWILIANGLNYKGAWAATQTGSADQYRLNDIVVSGNETYIALDDHESGATFGGDAAHWEKIAAKGTDGVGDVIPTEAGHQDEVLYSPGGVDDDRAWGSITAAMAPLHSLKASPVFTGQATLPALKGSITAIAALVLNLGSTANFLQTKTLSANSTFTTSNRASGTAIDVRLTGHATTLYTLTWPAGWVWLTAIPSDLAATKNLMLSLRCYGSADTDVIAMAAVET